MDLGLHLQKSEGGERIRTQLGTQTRVSLHDNSPDAAMPYLVKIWGTHGNAAACATKKRLRQNRYALQVTRDDSSDWNQAP